MRPAHQPRQPKLTPAWSQRRPQGNPAAAAIFLLTGAHRRCTIVPNITNALLQWHTGRLAKACDQLSEGILMSEQTVDVVFNVAGQIYSGQAPRTQIVHQVMEHLLPASVLHAHRLRITRHDGTLIYPDMFLGEIAQHYGD